MAEAGRKTERRIDGTSLAKALAILRLVATHNVGGINLTGVVRQGGLSTTSAHRLLHALVSERFLSLDPYTKRYHLGSDAAALGAAADASGLTEDLRLRLRCALEAIADSTGDTTYLSVRCGLSAVCIDKVPGSFVVATNTLDLGARRPLGVGAGSLALLAAADPDEAASIVSAHSDRYESYGLLDAAKVARAVAVARRDGYAFNDSLIIEGVGAIGVPVFNNRRTLVAAISVAAISSRLRASRREEMLALVRTAVEAVQLTIRRTDVATDTVLPPRSYALA